MSKNTVTSAKTPMVRQISISPPRPSTPPPDFNQCVTGSSHFLPLPFPNNRLASQQNSENMVTEKNKMAAAVEEANFLKMNCYSTKWEPCRDEQIQDGVYLSSDTNCYSPESRDMMCLQIQNGGPDGLMLKDKRRFSRTSGTSSRTRADDLSV